MIWIVEEIRTGWIFHRWQWVRDTGGSPSDYASSSHQWWKKTKQSMVSKSKSSDTILWKKNRVEEKEKQRREGKRRSNRIFMALCKSTDGQKIKLKLRHKKSDMRWQLHRSYSTNWHQVTIRKSNGGIWCSDWWNKGR